MSEAAPKEIEPPKPIEIAQLRLQCAELFVLLAIAIAGAWKWASVDSKLAAIDLLQKSAELRQKELAISKAEGETLSLQGEIHAVGAIKSLNGRSLVISPVIARIKNDGQTILKIEQIDFRVFVAPSLQDVSTVALFGPHNPEIELAVKEPKGIFPTAGIDKDSQEDFTRDIVGFIDPDSPHWIEKPELHHTIKTPGSILPAGQTRIERRHLLLPINPSDVLTKVEIIVTTNKSTQRWYGLGNGALTFCEPGPSDATLAAPPNLNP